VITGPTNVPTTARQAGPSDGSIFQCESQICCCACSDDCITDLEIRKQQVSLILGISDEINLNEYFSSLENYRFENSLYNSQKFWHSLTDSMLIFDIIREGYSLPFETEPPTQSFKNNFSAFCESAFVQNSICELLKNGCVSLLSSKPTVCNPLSVSKQANGKMRLILDLRYVNDFLMKESFKLEDYKIAEQYLLDANFLVSFDLKKGYHHIEINSKFRQFLGFSWKFSNKEYFFSFNVLPFGLSTAPFIFTKLLRPLVRKWRSEGIKIVLYLDDGLVCFDNKTDAFENTLKIQSDLHQAGFQVNIAKSCLAPTQSLSWLGFQIDLQKREISVPYEKLLRTKSFLKNVLKSKKVTLRTLAICAGKIISLSLVFSSITLIKTKFFFHEISKYRSCSKRMWNKTVFLTVDLKNELSFWINLLSSCYSRKIATVSLPDIVIYSDASATAGASIFVKLKKTKLECFDNAKVDGRLITPNFWHESKCCQANSWEEFCVQGLDVVELGRKMTHTNRAPETRAHCVATGTAGETGRPISDIFGTHGVEQSKRGDCQSDEALTLGGKVARSEPMAMLGRARGQKARLPNNKVGGHGGDGGTQYGRAAKLALNMPRPENRKVLGKAHDGRMTEVGKVTRRDFSMRADISSNKVAHIQWSSSEMKKSSTWRELKVIQYSLEAFRSTMSGNKIVWYTDNQPLLSIIRKGSMNNELNELAMKIFYFLESNMISMRIHWIPRKENEIADQLSRIVDHDDWGVSHEFFGKMDKMWGPHTVDRFANYKNKKLPRFNSRFWNPGTETVDCFTTSWKYEVNWMVPPPYLVIKCIEHLKCSESKGTLLIPTWSSAPLWPLLFHSYRYAIKHEVLVENINDYLIGASLSKSIFSPEKFRSSFTAVFIDFSS